MKLSSTSRARYMFLMLYKRPNAVGISKFANNHPSTPYPFKSSSWLEILSLPALIYVAILLVLWRPVFLLLALSIFPTPSVYAFSYFSTIVLSTSQELGSNSAFQGNHRIFEVGRDLEIFYSNPCVQSARADCRRLYVWLSFE